MSLTSIILLGPWSFQQINRSVCDFQYIYNHFKIKEFLSYLLKKKSIVFKMADYPPEIWWLLLSALTSSIRDFYTRLTLRLGTSFPFNLGQSDKCRMQLFLFLPLWLLARENTVSYHRCHLVYCLVPKFLLGCLVFLTDLYACENI